MAEPVAEERIPIALVGAGRFGLRHALRLAQHPEFELVCVVDPRAEARRRAATLGVPLLSSIDALPAQIEAAAVTASSEQHAALALALLHRGLDLLVEKPLALSVSDAQAVQVLAARLGRTLLVGHNERFNPWIDRRLPLANLASLSFERHSVRRGSAEEAVMDLMVHDLDLAAAMLRLPTSATIDILDVESRPDAASAALRMGEVSVSMRCCYGADRPSARVSWRDRQGARSELDLRAPYPQPVADALSRQYSAFRRARAGQPTVAADGKDGLAAVRRAVQVCDALAMRTPPAVALLGGMA